eukprot:jgi/Mesen1/6048/ME000308S05242
MMRSLGRASGQVQATVLLIIAFLVVGSYAFKAHEFKTCDQAHFCKRNRDRAPNNSSYVIKSGSLSDGIYTGVIQNTAEEGVEFSIQISAYGPSIVRLRINEEPSKKRFEVPDVLNADLESLAFKLTQGTKKWEVLNYTPLKVGEYDINVHHTPFRLDVLKDDQIITSFNSKGLFNFEHLRVKKEEEEDGLWTESFKGHTDSKPKGPESISFDVTFYDTEHVYGIPERATSLALKPTRGPDGGELRTEPYRLYNLDVFEYDAESPFGLYGAIPLMLSHSPVRTTGFFWLNAAEMWVDVLAPGWDGAAPGGKRSGIVDAFFLLGPTPKEAVSQYAAVTATQAMPPLFAVGYHQCRWNYKDEADVDGVDAGFDAADIPYDTLWLDIEHTDGKRYMTWDAAHFPRPAAMQERLAARGRHTVTIVDPHVKRDDAYPIYKEASQKGYFIKNAAGGDFDGWCWPGASSYLDMLSAEIRAWWAGKFSLEAYAGSTRHLHIWNDMNEPSVFNGPEVTMPKDAVHVGGVEHRDVHNAYGYYYHLASSEGLLKRANYQERPFVLSRAKYAGTQRAGAVWTGDNTADWEHLRKAVPMVATLGLAGIAFSGADVGGFFGNPDAELLTRWYQVGAFYPFFRGHAHLDTKRREPWLFGEPWTSHIREAIRTRYALLPYVYTLFKDAYDSGVPVLRPLFLEFPQDPLTFARDDSFMVGPALLVRGVMEQGATSVSVYFPGDEAWYDYKSGQRVARGGGGAGARTLELPVDMASVPVFQRAGTIVARKDRTRRSSTQMDLDPYTLVVALNSTGGAEGELYIDDGKSYEFREGAFLRRHFVFRDGRLSSSDAAAPPGGAGGKGFASTCVVERVVVMGAEEAVPPKHHQAVVENSGVKLQRSVLENAVEPKEGEVIMRVVAPRGSNLIEVEDVEGLTTLAILPNKFHKLLWLKRGNYVVVEGGGREEAEKAGSRVTGTITRVLYPDQIRSLQKASAWPAAFDAKPEPANSSARTPEGAGVDPGAAATAGANGGGGSNSSSRKSRSSQAEARPGSALASDGCDGDLQRALDGSAVTSAGNARDEEESGEEDDDDDDALPPLEANMNRRQIPSYDSESESDSDDDDERRTTTRTAAMK